MIHLITNDNRHLYTGQIEQLHRLRKRIFVDELGWQLQVTGDGEYDVYDDERAVNLVGFDEHGQIEVATRMRPADDKALLTDLFPHLIAADEPPINDATTWEFTRTIAIGRARGSRGVLRKAQLRVAMLEVARNANARRIVGITDVLWLPTVYDTGWSIRLLGLPAPYAEGNGIAFEIAASEAHLAAMREQWGVDRALLYLTPEVARDVPPLQLEQLLTAYRALTSPEQTLALALAKRAGEVDDEQALAMIEWVKRELKGETPHA